MVLCGLGGVFVEVLKDVSSGLVPLLATPKAVVAVDAAYPNRKIGLFFHSLRHSFYIYFEKYYSKIQTFSILFCQVFPKQFGVLPMDFVS